MHLVSDDVIYLLVNVKRKRKSSRASSVAFRGRAGSFILLRAQLCAKYCFVLSFSPSCQEYMLFRITKNS